jgi:N-acetylglucosamine kinase-like BadF-type ATPase
LVIGADVGGTSTRFVVADITGRVLAGAEGGPGSPVGVGLDVAAGEIRSVAERALRAASGVWTAGEETGATTPRVVGYVLGLAGGSQAKGNPRFAAAISPAGVGVSPQLVSDPAVAFCSPGTIGVRPDRRHRRRGGPGRWRGRHGLVGRDGLAARR